MILGLGIVGLAQSLSGLWDTEICFDIQSDGAISVASLDSLIDLQYLISGWTFGGTAEFDLTGLTDIWFYGFGSLGAFELYTMTHFNPAVPEFVEWDNAVRLSLAGVYVYGLFSVEGGESGSGFTLGGYGTVGLVSIWAEANFDLAPTISTIYLYGYEFITGRNYIHWWTGAYIDVTDTDCTVDFSGFGIYAEMPLAGCDLLLKIMYDCDGFSQFCINFNDLEIGLAWLYLDDFDICFTTQTKDVTISFEVTVGEYGCFVPYFSVLTDEQWEIVGISLDALVLSYSYNGVTFKAAEIFNLDAYGFDVDGYVAWWLAGGSGPDEFFGIEIDGDSCCGGAFAVGVYNFFNSSAIGGTTGIFDWEHTYATLTFGVGTNVTLDFSLEIDYLGNIELCLSAEFAW
jgi:hypothetical protein